jgi:hypothetical protein
MRALLTIGVLLAISAAANAQRWGHERFPQSGACFFQDADFRGEYFCVGAGANVAAVPDDLNDGISSIRVFGKAEVVVFRDVRFGGGSTRFGSSIRNLKDEGWNDRISSLRVQLESSGREGDVRGRPDDRRDERRDDRRPRGEDVDRIIRRAYQDVLGRDPDEGGLRQYRSRIIDDGWTEEQVRNSLRNSPEYRDKITMTRAKAQEIVRRAYLAVLKREPDAAGSEGYINSVLRDNWSQQDVERELRKSPEFRGR